MKVIILAAVLLWVSGVQAQERIRWYSLSEAIEMAMNEPRVLVVDVYTDWCGWCKRMDATTFSDPGIVEMMNTHFYPVKLDAEGREDVVIGERTYKFVDNGRRGYHELAAIVTNGRLSYPTISYVDSQGRILQAVPGYKHPDQFRNYLVYFRDEIYKEKSYDEYIRDHVGDARMEGTIKQLQEAQEQLQKEKEQR